MGLSRAWLPSGNSTVSLNWVPPSFCSISRKGWVAMLWSTFATSWEFSSYKLFSDTDNWNITRHCKKITLCIVVIKKSYYNLNCKIWKHQLTWNLSQDRLTLSKGRSTKSESLSNSWSSFPRLSTFIKGPFIKWFCLLFSDKSSVATSEKSSLVSSSLECPTELKANNVHDLYFWYKACS